MNNYYVYMIRCSDNSIYTGITTDIDRRMMEHKSKSRLGAKYTRNHDFLKLEIYFQATSRSLASKAEYNIKKLSKREKEEIITSKSLSILSDKLDINNYVKVG